jgi:hypothetical protein
MRRHERRVLLETNSIDLYRNGFSHMWPQFIEAGDLSTFRETVLSSTPSPQNCYTNASSPSRTSIPVISGKGNRGTTTPSIAKGRGHRPVIPLKRANEEDLYRS